jgi:hypothetical protein
MHKAEPFTDQRHLFMKDAIFLETLATEKIPVRLSPISQRLIAFSFVVGETLWDFVERRDKDFNRFNHRYGDPVPV